MTSFHFQTHVSNNGEVAFPPLPAAFYGEDVVVNVDIAVKNDDPSKPKRTFDELCVAWRDDERTAEEIIRDIYESRVNSRDRGPL